MLPPWEHLYCVPVPKVYGAGESTNMDFVNVMSQVDVKTKRGIKAVMAVV